MQEMQHGISSSPPHFQAGGRMAVAGLAAGCALLPPPRSSGALTGFSMSSSTSAAGQCSSSQAQAQAAAGPGRRDPIAAYRAVMKVADAIAAERPRFEELAKEERAAHQDFIVQQKEDPDSPEVELLRQRVHCIWREQAAVRERVAEMRRQVPGAAVGGRSVVAQRFVRGACL